MRGPLTALAAALTAALLAAIALGQDFGPLSVTGSATQKQAGTPHHPRGVGFNVYGTIASQEGTSAPMPQSIDIWLPKGWRYNGAKHPSCALTTLSHGGPRRCPLKSIVSRGPAGHADVVDASTPPSVVVVNGGANELWLWVVIQNPARVASAVRVTISTLRSPRWAARLHADVPAALQVVAGVSTSLDSFRMRTASDDWVTTTNCPRDGRWRAHLRLTYTSGQVADADGSVACRG